MSPKVEQKDLQRLREGDQISFGRIYEAHHQRVYGFCFKLVSSKQVAEEITEDVFFRLWCKRAIIDPSLPISHLLFKIARDHIWNYLKKASREAQQKKQYLSSHQLAYAPDPAEDLILQNYLQVADTAIQQLPEKRQLIYKLHYKGGLGNAEIGKRLNISESTVRVHLMKAKKFLRHYLKTHLEIPLWLLLFFQ